MVVNWTIVCVCGVALLAAGLSYLVPNAAEGERLSSLKHRLRILEEELEALEGERDEFSK